MIDDSAIVGSDLSKRHMSTFNKCSSPTSYYARIEKNIIYTIQQRCFNAVTAGCEANSQSYLINDSIYFTIDQ